MFESFLLFWGCVQIKGKFEYPMTKISANVSKIAEEVLDICDGSICVKNLGGGVLVGNIMADSEAVLFEETMFEGNDVCLKYTIDVRNYEPQKLLKFDIYIVSNGGELTIPVFIKVLKNIFYTDDGYKISNIRDFFSYSKRKPKKAADIFYLKEFYDWLVKINFEYTNIVKMLLKESNKEKALENFFVFCKIKRRPFTDVVEKNINVVVKPFQKDIVMGSIVVLKKGHGYIYRKIDLKYNFEWIKLDKKEITSEDFDDENRCYINYEIDPMLIDGNFSKECVLIDESTEAEICVRKLPKIVVSLSDEVYEYEDSGFISIENNCGKDLLFEVEAKDSFIEFEAKHYIVGEKDKIPFKIKRSKINSFLSRVSFNKKLYTESEIYIKTFFDNKLIKKCEKVVLGVSLL